MSTPAYSSRLIVTVLLLAVVGLVSCAPAGDDNMANSDTRIVGERWSYHDWPTGPYQVDEDWICDNPGILKGGG